MARSKKVTRTETRAIDRDRKRDRSGWKAARTDARRNKDKRHAFEQSDKNA